MMATRTVLLLVVGLCAIGAVNWATWHDLQRPPLAAADGAAWLPFAAIRKAGEGWEFPPDLAAHEGHETVLSGVLFTLPQLVHGGLMDGAVLGPPSRFGCCGLSCDARPQFLVFVDLPTPQPAPAKNRRARVTGTLRLQREGGGWTATTLEGARVELLADAP